MERGLLRFGAEDRHPLPAAVPWQPRPDPCQILEGRQMGPALYVLIKEEFAPAQTRHL